MAEQIIQTNPVNLSVFTGSNAVFNVIYQTEDPVDESLLGLGLRLHYNSSKLEYRGLDDILQTSLTPFGGEPQADTENSDGDASTDRFILLAWADLSNNWPGDNTTPATLYTARFLALDDRGTANINFSAASTSPGYTLDAESLEIQLAQRAPTNDRDRIIGTARSESLRGLGGNDAIFGRGRDDTLRGDDGNDVLYGEAGNDTLLGGQGDDSLRGDIGRDRLDGSTGNDRLLGGDDADVLLGGGGSDRLEGQDGNDQLRGGSERDILLGGTGDDRLDGEGGNDTITTGAGRDVIVIREGQGVDRVTDFQNRRDTIDLVGIRFGQLTILQQRDDVLIKLGSNTLLRLEDINISAIDRADFV